MTSPVAFTWDTPAKSAMLVFQSNEGKKLQMTKGSSNKHSYSSALPPGKYHYYFIIDNKRQVNSSKPIEKIGKEAYNVIVVQPFQVQCQGLPPTRHERIDHISSLDFLVEEVEDPIDEPNAHQEIKSFTSFNSNNSNSKVINNNLTTSNNKRDNTNHDISNTFSIKKENQIHRIDHSSLEANSFIENNCVIVYNYEDQYLIPMEIIKDNEKDETLLRLKHAVSRKEYVMSKDDIFYERADPALIHNRPYGDLGEMREVNELSILKNIQMRLRANKTFMFAHDEILLCFYNGVKQTDRDFFLSEYIKSSSKQDQALIVRSFSFNNRFNQAEDDELLIIRKYIEVNLPYDHWRCYQVIAQFLKLIAIRMKYSLRLEFNPNNSVSIGFIPSLSSTLSLSDLYTESILYDKKAISLNFKPKEQTTSLNDFVAKSFASICFKNNPGSLQLSMLFNKIHRMIISTQSPLLKSIEKLLTDLNQLLKYPNVIKLVVISFIALHYAVLFSEDKGMFSSLNIGLINEKNLICYSNLSILLMINYITYLIESVLGDKGNAKETARNLIILFNHFDYNEDDDLLNEAIKKRAMRNSLTELNSNSISNYYRFYLQENLSSFEQGLSSADLKLISLFENLYELDFLSVLSANSIANYSRKSFIVNAFCCSCLSSIDRFQEEEARVKAIHQVWRIDLGESFESFATEQEKVAHFFHMTQIVEYIKSSSSLKGDFFRSYRTKAFFNYFFPILPDIDTVYREGKDYSKSIANFISDIQTNLSFKEQYSITPSAISVNYCTFEIIMTLLKNVYEDHVLILQAKVKAKAIREVIAQLRKSVLRLQLAWRRVLYRRYTQMTQRECFDRIFAKYKAKDQMLLMYLIKTQKEILSLENDKIINNNLNTLDLSTSLIKNDSFIPKRNSKTKKPESKPRHYTQNITQSSLSKKNSGMNTSITRSEINSLKEKLSDSREQYKELVNVLVEYEKKLENFIGLINSNQEVKDVLNKNGIQIN